MMQDWMPSFLDEMTKVSAAELNPRERTRQAIQFGLLGAASGPVVGAINNIIQKGHPLPEGVRSIPRWLAGAAATGAIFSGAVPVLRHHLERNIQLQANNRVRRARIRAEKRSMR
jgi:hypothetical protein